MIDFKKVCAVPSNIENVKDSQDNGSEKKEPKRKIIDSRKKRILDSRKKRILDSAVLKVQSTNFSKFKVTDSYKSLKKRIKDALSDTEDTESAVAAVLDIFRNSTEPAPQVLAACIEVLGGIVDILQDKLSAYETEPEDEPELDDEPESDDEPEPEDEPEA